MKLLDVLERDFDCAEETKPEVGLSSSEAAKRLDRDGENVLQRAAPVSGIKIFLAQYKDIMTVILLICTLVSVFMGELVEAAAIAAIVVMNGFLGFIQEYRSEKTLEALKNLASPTARVYRDGELSRIPASELVRGDVIEVQAGDKIPADCTILSSANLSCDESMLTGESHTVPKDESTPELFMGCIIKSGRAKAAVTKTGMNTEMGKIALMLSGIQEEATPLKLKLQQLSKYIAAGCLLICLIVSVTGILRGEDTLQMLITGVSLAVAAVPEGLPAIVTISLALSVSRMVKRKALVRRLHAVETLGCATVICSDKTGTITQNRMSAAEAYISEQSCAASNIDLSDKTAEMLMKTLALCNNAVKAKGGESFGGATELALTELAEKNGFLAEKLGFKRISEQPFDSDRKRMSVVVQNGAGEKFLLVKGAFDVVLSLCTGIEKNGTYFELTPALKKQIAAQSTKMASGALRVIGTAYKKITPVSPSETEDNLTFLGLIGLIDPPRREVKRAVSRCRRASIRVVMITGDHKNTAIAIAKQVGIYKEGDLALTGAELDSMSDEELRKAVAKATVFSRVNPGHKLKIVRALKANGNVTAMTGDGVNDAPAIKEADIGVSMGQSGSDVTKEAADIILLDDNFSTLVTAISEGRSIYNNIRKFIRYLLSCNIGEVITMFAGMLMGMPVILLPIQILLINLVTDGLPAIALGLEPSDDGDMNLPPRKAAESVFSHGLSGKIIFRGILIGFTTLFSFSVIFNMTGSLVYARSGALFTLIFAQLIHVFECKSETKNLWHINYFNNKKLLLAAAVSLVTMASVLYFPPLSSIFSTAPLTLSQIGTCLGICLVIPVVSSFFHKK